MPSLQSIVSSLGAAARKVLEPRGSEFAQLSRRVLKGNECLRCCQQGRVRALGQVVGIINDVLALVGKADGHTALGLLPVGGLAGVFRAIAVADTIAASTEAAAMAAMPGLIVLLSAAEFHSLGQQQGAFEAIGVITSAIGVLQQEELAEQSQRARTAKKTRVSDCERCVSKRLLTQSHKRHRERVKINRRL